MGGAGCGATAIVCPDGQRKHPEQIARKALHIRPEKDVNLIQR